ncbi:MAG: tRNA pseudouridine(13) synthase TruD [Planctomycetes bacterium]|nr:tRNA pseudouridine(13) synthase TruD [Planctomycetota bacterium]
MRLKRIQDDFRVFEVLDEESLLGPGPFTLYRVTKRGLTTHEAVDQLAKEANVSRDQVAVAGLKDKDGITGQFMTVEGGKPVQYKDRQLTLRGIGSARRAIESADNRGNSFEIVVRDMEAADMARVRRNIAAVRSCGLPAYFDDQRFGCLRHGQGFIVRQLLRGDHESAVRALLCAPSKYGNEAIEKFKAGISRRWGDWDELASYCRGRRGASLFEHLREEPKDFLGALVRGVATRERTIHLFAYQSHLWNHAAALWVRAVVPEESIGWLPGDDGALPVFRELPPELLRELHEARLPLFGEGADLSPDAERYYQAVFRSEGVDSDAFRALDISGFRPQGEDRPLLMMPEYLRAAPAERDELHAKRSKMRLRFTLPRGHYATLVAKRLAMPTSADDPPPRLYVSRHRLDFPDKDGRMPDEHEQVRRDDERRWHARRYEQKQERKGGGSRGERPAPGGEGPWKGKPRDDDRRGPRREDDRRPGDRKPSPWVKKTEGGGTRQESPWKGKLRDEDPRRKPSERPAGRPSPWKKKPDGGGSGSGSRPPDKDKPAWGGKWKPREEDDA